MARTAQTGGSRPAARGGLSIESRRHPLVAVTARQLQRCGVRVDSHGRPAKVVVGVSGGPDSVALLLACTVIAGRRDSQQAFIEPIAVHVHHHLRSSADDDARFVESLCEKLGIEFHLRHVEPARRKGNVASSARRLRYEALSDVAIQRGAKFIAVAHHAEDQFETMLMAMCRGAGLDGLSAMNLKRDLGASVSLIRPLLGLRKSDCEGMCRAAGVKWRIDPSNRDVNRARARLRCDVIPVLESLWPDAARRVSATADAIASAREVFEKEIRKEFGPATERSWSREHLRALPSPLLAAGLRRAAVHLAPLAADELDQVHLLEGAAAIADDIRRPRRFAWPGDVTLEVRSNDVILRA